MGRPLPGIDAAIVHTGENGAVDVIETPDEQGELALRPGWPSMFRGYLERAERYRKCFVGGCYLTGDLAQRDRDGYYWFVGRTDDVIKTSGHLIGPFEVESVLMEHPAVAEAGVIGKPDPVALEIVKAFVASKPATSRTMRWEGAARLARKRLGAAVAPKEIDFVARFQRRAAARSCAGCSRRGNWGCPKAIRRHWSVPDDHRAAWQPAPSCNSRARARTCCGRCCAFAASRRSVPSCTARARFAGSSISTSVRRRWRLARCRRSRRTTRSSRRIANTVMRWRAAFRWRVMAEMYGKAKAAATAAADRCTSSMRASLLRRQRHRRRRSPDRGRTRPRRPDAAAPPRHGVLLR